MNINNKKIPKHIAIIMDGNGRWANIRKKNRIYGHREGLKSLNKIIDYVIKIKLNVLTLYAFSSENWNRPYLEVNELMKLFYLSIKRKTYYLHKKNVCVKIIGDKYNLPSYLYKNIVKIEYLTRHNSGLKLNIAINYGGRWDIINCIKKIIDKIFCKIISLSKINDIIVSKNLCLGNIIPVDLVIRTGGEKRISNFLLWQIAYSELYFTDVLWPDFNIDDFLRAIENFSFRDRRFGKISN